MSVPYFDAHCDTGTAALRSGEGLRSNRAHLDLTRLAAYSPAAQVFAVFSRPEGHDWQAGYEQDSAAPALAAHGAACLDALLRELERNADIASLCRSAQEARQAAAQGRIAVFLAIEGAELLGSSVEGLRAAHAKGVRLVNLTWNYRNPLCGTNQTGGGLTAAGRDFVRAAQALGVAVDVSHASDAGFWDCMELAVRPLLAGHSNARALCAHPRNLTDEMFSALVRSGGAAGLNLCPAFLGEKPDLDTCFAHVEHFLALGGEKTVCLGTDFDGVDDLPRGIAGVQDAGALWECLLRHNLPESLVRDIFYNNLLSYLERALN